MRVLINGEKQTLDGGLNITALLLRLGVDTRQVAVEKNREIIPKSQYDGTAIAEGDEIEIVGFIGGG